MSKENMLFNNNGDFMHFDHVEDTEKGKAKKRNEDAFLCRELDGENLVVIIADGRGSNGSGLNPAYFLCDRIYDELAWIFRKSKTVFLRNPRLYLENAIRQANNLLCAMKLANNEIYSGMFCSLTAAVFMLNDNLRQKGFDGAMCCLHCGTTALYHAVADKNNAVKSLMELTKDQTIARERFERGEYKNKSDIYFNFSERAVTTSETGHPEESRLNLMPVTCGIRKGDIFAFMTKGIYHVIDENKFSIVLDPGNRDLSAALGEKGITEPDWSQLLVYAAHEIVGGEDDATAAFIGIK